MTQEQKKLAAAVVVALVVGGFIASSVTSGYVPNPFVPQQPDRPVLKFIAKVAKTFLWVAVFAEPKPQLEHTHIVHAAIGPDGHEFLNHAEGF